MVDEAIINAEKPVLILPKESGGKLVVLVGPWSLRTLVADPALRQSIKKLAVDMDKQWDISQIERLDSAAAFLLWQAWGEKLPADLIMRPEHRRLFEYCHYRKIPTQPTLSNLAEVLRYGQVPLRGFYQHMRAWLTLFGRLIVDSVYLFRHPRATPYKEISSTIYKAGVSALGITALVGFLVGISISYLSSLQLQRFGAEIYIIDLLGLSIIRELGPMLTAILVAGRSGSAMTAEIGIMRVTQELDALAALGISHSLRLVLPKVIALSIALPLLIVWTDAMALIGGMVSAQLTLDIGYQQFLDQLPKAVPIVNFYIGLAKGVTFGMMIAMIACHYGFSIKPNTESLGNETTHSVVVTITVVILMDALFSILFKNVGFP
ncbi:MlaE family ABC transporter permease [Nitrosovibrio tenuis]|uniref:Phospholipid/cholesterol/gamma-HCH transport system permease protein n=1 Tax=Nitrosovibrio tenuis TaxID=1233 RepID=A0A1H7PXA9_9PROT|nr:ABC transporter permease [Nitrosovibrio tenuis]SEL39895.1 phospholipid/cholesterol/gamma-HCH transport system permease protein [Nitrosovibrio tenuis]